MRRLLMISFVVVIFLALFLGGSGYAMSEGTVFRPDNSLFQLQRFVEHRRASLTSDSLDKAFYLLRIAERRTYDLEALVGSPGETNALNELYTALQESVFAIGKTPLDAQPELKLRLGELVAKIENGLTLLKMAPAESPGSFRKLQALVGALSGMVGAPIAEQVAPVANQQQNEEEGALPTLAPTATIDPQVVEFPQDSQGASHAFFELTGKHTLLACESCHIEGKYAGTPRLCILCHLEDRPEEHFEFDCVSCHAPEDWALIIFDHTLVDVQDCQSCHLENKPLDHYNGQCSACHQTTGWLPASFNHQAAGAVDCQGCHAKSRPSNHFSGQCSSCHKTTGWLPATFNHANAGNNCQGCHKPPAGHWSGECSKCHTSSGWSKISMKGHSFPTNHGGAGGNCSACHSSNSTSVNCYKCHNQAKMVEKHNEEGISNIAGRCLSCHPNGDKED